MPHTHTHTQTVCIYTCILHILYLEIDLRRFLVEPDSNTLELPFQEFSNNGKREKYNIMYMYEKKRRRRRRRRRTRRTRRRRRRRRRRRKRRRRRCRKR